MAATIIVFSVFAVICAVLALYVAGAITGTALFIAAGLVAVFVLAMALIHD